VSITLLVVGGDWGPEEDFYRDFFQSAQGTLIRKLLREAGFADDELDWAYAAEGRQEVMNQVRILAPKAVLALGLKATRVCLGKNPNFKLAERAGVEGFMGWEGRRLYFYFDAGTIFKRPSKPRNKSDQRLLAAHDEKFFQDLKKELDVFTR
jgi:hypothetical protein